MEAGSGPSKARPPIAKTLSYANSSTSATPSSAGMTTPTGKGKEPKKVSSRTKKGLSPLGSERSSIVSPGSNLDLKEPKSPEEKASKKTRKAKKTSSPPKADEGDQAGDEKKRKKMTAADGSVLPASAGAASAADSIIPNMPTLWIRAVGGGIKVLNNAPAAAPSAAEPGVRIKAKKSNKGIPKTDAELWAAFDKQQQEEKLLEEKKAAKALRKAGGQAGGAAVEDVFANIPLTGVKITLEQTSEPFRIKEDEINRTLMAQILQVEKDNLKKEMAKPKEEAKKKIVAKVVAKKPHTKHSWYITHDTYMFHLHQPNLMSPLFDLPSDRQILFGPYESKLDKQEAKVWEQPVFRPLENVFLPEVFCRSQKDLSVPRSR